MHDMRYTELISETTLCIHVSVYRGNPKAVNKHHDEWVQAAAEQGKETAVTKQPPVDTDRAEVSAPESPFGMLATLRVAF